MKRKQLQTFATSELIIQLQAPIEYPLLYADIVSSPLTHLKSGIKILATFSPQILIR